MRNIHHASKLGSFLYWRYEAVLILLEISKHSVSLYGFDLFLSLTLKNAICYQLTKYISNPAKYQSLHLSYTSLFYRGHTSSILKSNPNLFLSENRHIDLHIKDQSRTSSESSSYGRMYTPYPRKMEQLHLNLHRNQLQYTVWEKSIVRYTVS